MSRFTVSALISLAGLVCGMLLIWITEVHKASSAVRESFATPAIITSPDGKTWVAEHIYGDRFTIKPITILETPK